MQDYLKYAANSVLRTNTAFFDLMHDSLEDVTIRHLVPGEVGLVSLESDGICLVEELRNKRDPGKLIKLMDIHFEKMELEEFMPLHNFMIAADAATQLFLSFQKDGLTFSARPFGLTGLQRVTHKPKKALAPPPGVKTSYFSRTVIDDHSTAMLQARGMRKLHFHTKSSTFDWVCVARLDDPIYASTFQSEESPVWKEASNR